MDNGQCYCYSGFSGSDCGDNLTTTKTQKNGLYLQSTVVYGCTATNNTNKKRCENGTCQKSVGYCVCNTGFKDLDCSVVDRDYISDESGSDFNSVISATSSNSNSSKPNTGTSANGSVLQGLAGLLGGIKAAQVIKVGLSTILGAALIVL